MAKHTFRVEKSSQPQKFPKGGIKAGRKTPVLYEPLSELAKDMKIPVFDILAYVNRSNAERRNEIDQGKFPGKVMRPLNSFMLYRKAYQNLANEWCFQMRSKQCCQALSQVVGDSWRLEPDSIKAQFVEWFRVERINHQKAHPDYSYLRGKTVASKAMKRKRSVSSSSSIEGSVSLSVPTDELSDSTPIYGQLVADLDDIMNY
jgi:hypothetical protein